jgi:hypothetical protein
MNSQERKSPEPLQLSHLRSFALICGSSNFFSVPTSRPFLLSAIAWVGVLSGGFSLSSQTSADENRIHWSFRRVVDQAPPAVLGSAWPRSPIDRFVLSGMEQHGLKPAPQADKRTLIRRATYDLTGLPPTPAETQAFLADDSPGAFAAVVDRLLSSPRYGERWGRHWLDLVRYADTAGETADFPVPHAWRYRNYVIQAFNHDKPYDHFLFEQIAGDILADRLPADAPVDRFAELVTATGCISIARRFGFDIEQDHYLTIDDTLDMLGKTVLGLTISCARCHDHKYDPISAADYYALYGIFDSTRYPFSGCEKTKSPRDMVPLMPRGEMDRMVKPHQERLARLEADLKKLSDGEAPLNTQIKSLAAAQPAKLLAEGQFDNGGAQSITVADKPLDQLALQAGQLVVLTVLPRGNHGADSTVVDLEITESGGNGRIWNVSRDVVLDLLAGNPHADSYGNNATWCFADPREGFVCLNETVRNIENKGGLNVWRRGELPAVFANATDQPIKAWTVTFPARSFVVHPGPAGGVAVGWNCPANGNYAVTGRLADADTTGGDGVAWKLEHASGDWKTPLTELGKLTRAAETLRKQREALAAGAPKFDVAYAIAEGNPHNARIQRRGDPKSLGDEVPRRFLEVLGGQMVPTGAGSGRLELAGWLTDRHNPLTARVMVNRIWQQHFGQGLVRTPSDFGTRGLPPSHPELLDFLVFRFVESGWSIKAMHRLMMLTQTYRQQSSGDADSAQLDPDNTWLSRFRRRRLSAEELRDAILAVSGDLDLTPGGPHPFPDDAKWGYTQHAPFSAVYEHNHRSVYLMTQRIKRHPFLTLFDGPDANASTADRYTTTVPTQALFFLNDPFVHARSANFAARLEELSDDRARLDRAYELLFCRLPTEADYTAAARFLVDYSTDLTGEPEAQRRRIAWSAWLRVLMSGNEFIYID